MCKRALGHWLGAMTLLCAGVVGAQNAAAPAQSAFGPGEQSTYRVSYLGVVAGSATITVGAETRQWGQIVLPIVTVARSESMFDLYPIRDKFVSYWSHAEERCIGSDLYADENRVKRRQRIRFDHEAKKATVIQQKEGSDEKVSTHEVAEGAFDIASATFALRNRPLEVGRVYELPVFTGSRSFTLRATVKSRQVLDTPLGKKEVFKVLVQTGFAGKLQSRRDLHAYFTADEDRIPVRIDAEFVLGTITAELVDYKSGRRYALRPQPSGAEGTGG